jgi:hypothetical protein
MGGGRQGRRRDLLRLPHSRLHVCFAALEACSMEGIRSTRLRRRRSISTTPRHRLDRRQRPIVADTTSCTGRR